MSRNRSHMGIRTKSTVSNTVLYVILVLMSIIWLTPFACILLESFRTESTGRVGYIIPKQWGFDNYINLWTKTSFPIWFRNTLITALATAVLQTLMVLSVSYVLSRLRFKGRKLLMNTCLVLGMFPGFVTMIVLYKVLSGMGLTGANSVPGLILVYCASSGMGYSCVQGLLRHHPQELGRSGSGGRRFPLSGVLQGDHASVQAHCHLYRSHCVHGSVGRLHVCQVYLPQYGGGHECGGGSAILDLLEDPDCHQLYHVLRRRRGGGASPSPSCSCSCRGTMWKASPAAP